MSVIAHASVINTLNIGCIPLHDCVLMFNYISRYSMQKWPNLDNKLYIPFVISLCVRMSYLHELHMNLKLMVREINWENTKLVTARTDTVHTECVFITDQIHSAEQCCLLGQTELNTNTNTNPTPNTKIQAAINIPGS